MSKNEIPTTELQTKLLALAEEISRESTLYQNEVPLHTVVMMEKWAAALVAIAAERLDVKYYRLRRRGTL